MKTATDIQFITTDNSYEVIENEKIEDCILYNRVISGALIKTTWFSHVTFENCTFFGSKMQESDFTSCHFSNCKFQFSNTCNSHFKGCHFENTEWLSSNISNSTFFYCNLDFKTTHYAELGNNDLTGCFSLTSVEMAA